MMVSLTGSSNVESGAKKSCSSDMVPCGCCPSGLAHSGNPVVVCGGAAMVRCNRIQKTATILVGKGDAEMIL
jgi:hypothetical protein